ncbi:MAG: indole-3-glycerol phosphate synthase TrpC [bacterium]|nr:indole-3-glycerol phosphate synthase TrpC [bacterium]
MTILEKIVATKKQEIAKLLAGTTLADIERRAKSSPAPRDFLRAIKDNGTSIIAELKKASPSRGIIRADFNPAQIARSYGNGGARAISVLTDGPYFQGHLSYLQTVHETVPLPLLRKDFILQEIQIWESRAARADAVLLIARILTAEKLRNLVSLALAAGLEPLVEIHNEIDLVKALATKARLIGINNRDLTSFTTDINVSLKLKKLIPSSRVTISESGIATREDIESLEKAGFDGCLIGETLIKARSIERKLSYLRTGSPADEAPGKETGETSERTELLRTIRDEVWNLKASPLYTYRRQNRYYPVLGEGNHRARVVFVGEAPGENEAKTGRPFCGAAGRVLDELLQSIGLPRKDVYITNILKDRPPSNRDPLPEEIAIYTPFLLRQLSIIKPKVLVTLGRFSMHFIMEQFGVENRIQTISKIHGQVFDVKTDFGPIKILPFYHPAVALYRQAMKETIKQDFLKLKSVLPAEEG